MADPIALVTGVTGQDGALLAELLLAKGYEVHGIMRRSSTISSGRLDRFYAGSHECNPRFFMHYGDLTDGTSLLRVLQKSQPSEIYNLGGQSHVKVSFETAESTADVNALGALRLLEAIRTLGMADRVRFFQAGSSEMFGSTPPPQNESTPFRPRSPYAISKLHAYWITANYREAYNLHASNGILFNHEGPTRGETFVTRKITTAVAAIDAGRQEDVSLGNLNARRDWGHARDYVEGVWRMLQQDRPDDYVLATGEAHTVREFVELAFKHVGVEIHWQGEGVDEKGLDTATGRVRVKIDPSYFRPTDVHDLRGDASKAREKLGWRPTMSFEQLVQEMVDSDRALLRRERPTEESSVR